MLSGASYFWAGCLVNGLLGVVHSDPWISLPVLLALHGLFLCVWLALVGGSIGSFLNVVIYRLPIGKNLVVPGSSCPNCGAKIRSRHNLPVVGWLLLRGRCYDCHIPISARYPLIELTLALIFGVCGYYVVDETSNMNPVGTISQLRYALTSIHPVPLWTAYGLQMLLATTLLAAAMIDYDGNPVPWRLFLPVWLVGAIVPLFLPEVHAWQALATAPERLPWQAGLLDTSLGLLAGSLAGVALSVGWRLARRLNQPPSFAPGLSLAATGLVLGWQPLLLVLGICSLGLLVLTAFSRWTGKFPAVTWGMLLLSAVLVVSIAQTESRWVVEWLQLATLPLFVGQLGLTFLLALLAARLAPDQYDRRIARSFPLDVVKEKETPPMTDPKLNLAAIEASPSYRLAATDRDFMLRPELRPVRMQLELLKPEMLLTEHNIRSTVVMFGGTAIVERPAAEAKLSQAKADLAREPGNPALQRAVFRAERVFAKSHYYDDARELARICSTSCQVDGTCDYVVITGGGPGIMEAANRGAFETGCKSIGLNITLPHEQSPNPYITPELCFQFHYFALRKMHFLMRAKALVVFPGGFGTLDEMFEVLTLKQTGRMQQVPVILFGREFWEKLINFQFLADEGVISDHHLELIQFAETPQEAWDIITKFHQLGETYVPTS